LIGCILAAGRGSRISHPTYSRPKALLTVVGMPLIYYPLNLLVGNGVRKIFIVVAESESPIKKYVGNKWNGVSVEYVIQSEPSGTGDSILTLECQIRSPFLLSLGDVIVDTVQLAPIINDVVSLTAEASLLSKIEDDPQKIRQNFEIRGGKSEVRTLVEKPIRPMSPYKGCGIYMFTPQIFAAMNRVKKAGGKNCLTNAVQELIHSGFRVTHPPLALRDANVNTWQDLNRANKNFGYGTRHLKLSQN